MKGVWLHVFVCGILAHPLVFAQQSGSASSNSHGPERGNIVNSVYVNEFLGFSFPIPGGWEVSSDNVVSNGEVQAKVSPGGGLILLVIDQHPGGALRNRIALSALDGKNVPADTQGFVAKFVRAQLDREGMSLVRDAFPVDFAGKHFFREDYKESSGAGVAYKAFVCIKFRDYFLGWTVATGSPSELEKSLHLLEPIQFLDEPISPSDAGGLPGTVPGDPPKGIVAGVINSDPRQSPSGRPLRVRVSQGVSQGLCVKRVNPQYPEEARHGRIQGQVVLQVEIDKNGDMKNVTLVSGHPLLAAAAMEAVKQWKYKPYLLEGQPVAVDTQVIVNFTLSGG